MKIGLHCQHVGLIGMLSDLWKEHDILVSDKPISEDVDIIVSTLPHFDLEQYNGKKPVIAYVTDPIFPDIKSKIEFLKKEKWFKAIGAEDCYPEKYVPITIDEYIPFAVNPKNYPEYKGAINKVLVVNRKAIDRFLECATGTRLSPFLLSEFMKDFKWILANEPDNTIFKNMYRDYKVLFYFAPSPFTIVMFEAMAVGMPIVALTHNQVERDIPEKNPIRKYLHIYSTDKNQLYEKLNMFLDNPPVKIKYDFMPFDEVKNKWELLFKSIL